MINRLACVFALGFLVAACGGDDDGDDDDVGDTDGGGDVDLDCSSFSACGGDPVGTWGFEQTCTEAGSINGCPEAVVDYSGISVDGSLTVNDDMTYSIATTQSGTVTLNAPLSCLGEGVTCADVGEEGVTCTEVGDTCQCEQTVVGEPVEENGTWVVDGSSFTMTAQGGEPQDPIDFCVEGDVLKVNFMDPEAGTEFTYSLQRQ